jgi:hypothetical protein
MREVADPIEEDTAVAAGEESLLIRRCGGLQVSHWMRAKPIGSAATARAPASKHISHWYQNARACSKPGTSKLPRG